jgi:uncharacterized membrane protein YfcA
MVILQPLELVTVVAIGLFAGVSSGLFGIGGGIIIVPALIFFLGFPIHKAIGTSLFTLIWPIGALGVWRYYREGILEKTHMQMGLILAICMLLGSGVGATIGTNLSPKIMQKVFAVFMCIMGLKLWFK